MEYLGLVRNLKKIRVIQKNISQKNMAKRIIKNMPQIKEMPSQYKKEIDRYWARYGIKVSGLWHQIYTACSGIGDVRYIDKGLFYSQIIGRLNYMKLSEAYDDKCRYHVLFPEIKQPGTLLRNVNGIFFDDNDRMLSRDQARNVILSNKKSVFKSSFGPGGGRGVFVFNQDDPNVFQQNLDQAFRKRDYIVQEFIQQNEVLSELNSASVNTIRILSFLWKGKVHILASLIRIGDSQSEIITNDTQCRLIGDDGRLSDFGHDENYRMIKGLSKNIYLPNFEQIVQAVKDEHRKIPYFSLIGWDWTIDRDGDPVLIEINTMWPGFETKQCLDGPLFGNLTDEVMEYVFEDKKQVLDSVYLGI